MRRVLLFLFFSFSSWGCDIQKGTSVLSLSGPVTDMFAELGLLTSPGLKALSSYSSRDLSAFKGEVIQGGLFLSPQKLQQYKEAVFFIDDSRELVAAIQKFGIKKGAVLKTLGLDPFQVMAISIGTMKPYLHGCEKKIKQLEKNMLERKDRLLKRKALSLRLLVYPSELYLGELKRPSHLMVNDGPIKFLIKNHLLLSYESDFAYVPYSWAKVESYKKAGKVIEVGIKETDSLKLSLEKLSTLQWQLKGKYSLIPGVRQLEVLELLVSELWK